MNARSQIGSIQSRGTPRSKAQSRSEYRRYADRTKQARSSASHDAMISWGEIARTCRRSDSLKPSLTSFAGKRELGDGNHSRISARML